MDFLTLAFMQRALLAALVAGLVSPTIGGFIVQRRLSLLGDGLGHVAIAGVGLALATGLTPLPVAVAVAIAGAVAIELLRSSGRASADVAMAVLFYGGLATGVLLAGLVGQGAGNLSSYLFGSLLTISTPELALIAVLGGLILVLALGLAPQLFAVCSDEDYARTLGLPVRLYNMLIVVLAAVTITVSMRTVGLLMVSALMIVPVATANNLARGFSRALGLAMGLGVASAAAGVVGSYYLNAPPGSLIVVVAIAIFVVTLPVAGRLRRARKLPKTVEDADPTPLPHQPEAAHEHVHGPGCGHPALVHGDHLDYVHDGHRHAAHEGHYDEH
ncbi:MAG: metal ABC transporter permease [Propionibacteriaceae bacterium]|jgi:zinc transport system permease protein|nr:metal ABC transporter permease [Propionibacteriaceae bacterium]